MATQAAVLAGFTTTCLIEISIPDNANLFAKYCLHTFAIVSICANICCVSLSTITTIWGSSKALRGRDGSMDEAVEGISDERNLIFNAFALGLAGNLCTVMSACFLVMDFPVSFFAVAMVVYTAWLIYSNARRIQRKFNLTEAVKLDDLTRYAPLAVAGTAYDPVAPFPASSSNGLTGAAVIRGKKSPNPTDFV